MRDLFEVLEPVLPAKVESKLSRADLSKPATYVLFHPKSQTGYIGSTGDLYHRIRTHYGHLRCGTHHNKKLQAAFDDDPKFDLRYKTADSREEAVQLEQVLLDRHLPQGNLLNVATDAVVAGRGRVVSENVKTALRQNALRQFSTEEARQKQSERTKKMWDDPDYRTNHMGRELSDVSKSKISDSVRQLWADPEYRERMASRRINIVVIDGQEYQNVAVAARMLNIPSGTLHSRLKRQKARP